MVAAVRDLDASGGVPVWFHDDDSVPPDPMAGRALSLHLPVTIEPSGSLAADVEATVTATGFQPGEPIVTAVCGPAIAEAGADAGGDAYSIFGEACESSDSAAVLTVAMTGELDDVTQRADADGAVTLTMPARTRLEPVLGTPDSDEGAGTRSIRCSDRENRCAFVIAAAADLQRSAIAPYTVKP